MLHLFILRFNYHYTSLFKERSYWNYIFTKERWVSFKKKSYPKSLLQISKNVRM